MQYASTYEQHKEDFEVTPSYYKLLNQRIHGISFFVANLLFIVQDLELVARFHQDWFY
jgi:hypothetical protein